MRRRVLRLLFRLLPEETRALYGTEMEVTFLAERRNSASRVSVTRLWLATIADVFRTAPREHLEIFWRDSRYAIRTSRHRAMHTSTAIATLALAIGMNVAMFAVIDAVLLEPLPYSDPRGLVRLNELGAEDREASNLGYLTFDDLRQRARSFEHLAAVGSSTATLTGGDVDPERVSAMRVSREYFELLGVSPRYGRFFTAEEDRPGEARRAVILSYPLFERRFGADANLVGSTIEISGRSYRLVGVMPETFTDLIAQRLYLDAQLWYPLGYDATLSYACRSCRHLSVFGRLAPSVDTAKADAEVRTLLQALEAEHPNDYHRASASVTPLADVFLGAVRPALLVLWAGVIALLLVACANIANFLLLRSSEREHEVKVRTAMGVSPARLTRQLLTEALLLSMVAGVLSLMPAWAAVRLLAAAGPSELLRLSAAAMDLRAFVACAVLVLASTVIFSLAPLRHLARTARVVALGAGQATDPADTWRLRSALLALSVALAAILLVGSGLLVRTMSGLLAVEPGFDPEGVLTLQLWATGERFRAEDNAGQVAATVSFYDEVLTRIEALPGVESAAAVSTLPLGGGVDGYSMHVVGRETENPESAPSADRFVVTPGFFELLNIGLVQGRYLGPADQQGGDLTAVINRTAAKELFPAGDALGQRLRLGPPDAVPRKVVGVVPDVKHHGLDRPVGYQVYVPQAQWVWAETAMTLVVRAGAASSAIALAPAVRAALREVDPAQPASRIAAYDDIMTSATATRRFAAQLLTIFAAAALVLSVVGLNTAVGVLVGQRRREIGLRIALGARARSIRTMMLWRGLRPVTAGLALGLLIAALSASALRSLVFGVGTLDPTAFGFAGLLLAVAATAACWLPAWRAAAVDPTTNLRVD